MPDTATYTDSELMLRVRANDSKALEALYNRYSPLLYTLIKKIIAEENNTREVLSDIFVIIWKKIELFDFTSDNVYTWLVTLARNKAVDTIKRRGDESGSEPYTDEYENEYIIPKLSVTSDPLDLETALNIKESVSAALGRLTDAQQFVISLAYYEGLTQNEIADRLKIPLPTVKSKIKIALSKLKDNLIMGGE
jgi:RNA polymerase sigma-70 factor, ECF subfamily